MSDNRGKLGRFGEDLAVSFLKKKGYKVVDRNFRTRWGEIDIVCVKGGKMIIAEVRTKSGSLYGTPEESVNAKKQEKLRMMAHFYLASKNRPEADFQIDGVFIEGKDGVYEIRHLENMVEEN